MCAGVYRWVHVTSAMNSGGRNQKHLIGVSTLRISLGKAFRAL
jgi:hypothetical protein